MRKLVLYSLVAFCPSCILSWWNFVPLHFVRGGCFMRCIWFDCSRILIRLSCYMKVVGYYGSTQHSDGIKLFISFRLQLVSKKCVEEMDVG